MDKESYEKALLESIVASILKHGGKEILSAIILSGSLGRGEPTYITDSEGKPCLKSDVEIGLVYSKVSQRKAVTKLASLVSAEFEEDLSLMAISERRVRKGHNYNFSLWGSRYKTIFTFDLYNGSRTIWGKDFLTEKTITAEMIDPYEAKRLVANRIGELIYLQSIKRSENCDASDVQWKGKLLLAIASAWLVCEGKYVSSYRVQCMEVLAHKLYIDGVIGDNFSVDYENVFRFLRDNGEPYEIADEILQGYVQKAGQYFKEKRITRAKTYSLSKQFKCLIRNVKTGLKFGIFDYEDRILQSMILKYSTSLCDIEDIATIWYRVLY